MYLFYNHIKTPCTVYPTSKSQYQSFLCSCQYPQQFSFMVRYRFYLYWKPNFILYSLSLEERKRRPRVIEWGCFQESRRKVCEWSMGRSWKGTYQPYKGFSALYTIRHNSHLKFIRNECKLYGCKYGMGRCYRENWLCILNWRIPITIHCSVTV